MVVMRELPLLHCCNVMRRMFMMSLELHTHSGEGNDPLLHSRKQRPREVGSHAQSHTVVLWLLLL